jgi:hypothetical protein
MNSLFLSILVSAFSHFHNADTRPDTLSQKMTIPVTYAFDCVTIYNNILVYITEGTENEIIVRDGEAANNIKFKVTDGVLVIRGKSRMFSGNNPDRMIITVKDIHCITVMDDAEVRSVGELSNQNLKLEIYGDGAIYVNTRAVEVNTFISGLGKIVVNGNFKNTTVNKDSYGNMVTKYK